MDLVARIEPGAVDGSIQLIGRSEVTMSGKAAAFGGRMMGTVADQILKQFAGNFAAQVLARAAAGKASAAGSAPEGELLTVAGSTAVDAAQNASAEKTHAATASDAAAKELNALSLLWAGLRDWFRGLFRRRAA